MQLLLLKFSNAQNAVSFVNNNKATLNVQTINVGWKHTYLFLTASEQRVKFFNNAYNLLDVNET